jgi:uncharacterized membrane protein
MLMIWIAFVSMLTTSRFCGMPFASFLAGRDA